MTKTTSGFVLVAGGVIVAIGIGVANSANFPMSAEYDFQHSLFKYAGLAIGLLGVAMFFFGALRFARG